MQEENDMKVCNVSSLQKRMQLKDHIKVAGTNWEFLSRLCGIASLSYLIIGDILALG